MQVLEAELRGARGHLWNAIRRGDLLQGTQMCIERPSPRRGERYPGQTSRVLPLCGCFLRRRREACRDDDLQVLGQGRVGDLEGVAQQREVHPVDLPEQSADPQPHRCVDRLVEADFSHVAVSSPRSGTRPWRAPW